MFAETSHSRHWVLAWLTTLVFSFTSPASSQTLPDRTDVVARKPGVDIALVLAVDVSSSIQSVERVFQRHAYAQALKDPRVAQVALGGGTGRVAIAYMEWSGRKYQRVYLPPRIMSSPEEISNFADDILRIPDHADDPMYFQATAVGDALIAAETAMSELDLRARDYVIDISGDGVLNDGSNMQEARDHVLSRGYVVNGLPIEVTGSPTIYDDVNSRDYVSRYYANCVIGGPGAFHLVARGYSDVRETLIMKLMLEMAQIPAREKKQIAEMWNRVNDAPSALIIPAMVLELAPNETGSEQTDVDCSHHEPLIFVP